VVQRILEHCDDLWRAAIAQRLMHWVDRDPATEAIVQRTVLDVATARYGSYVVVTLLGGALLRALPHQGQPLLDALTSEQRRPHERLVRSAYAKRVLEELAKRVSERYQ
jgi:hypothetical protein